MIEVFRKRHSDRGVALITATIVMMLVAMLGLGYVTMTGTNLIRASRDERRTTAFYLAESGLEYVIADIMDDAGGGVIVAQTFDSTPVVDGLRSPSSGTVEVVPDSGGRAATITSSATYRGITERVRIRLKIKDVSIWNNAIFAGIGSSGRGINGNVDIRGSVHILGDGDPFSDLNGNGVRDIAEPFVDSNGNGIFEPALGETFTDVDGNGVWSPAEPYQDNNLNGVYDDPLTATELATDISGSAKIGNNYSGIPADLQAKIPVVPAEAVGSEFIQTLHSELRVKHGKVNISGSANVGEPNVTGNAYKETADGCYVNDGYGGNKGASNVYSDNGTNQKYDMGDRVPFPSLLDEYTDPNTSITYNSYSDWLDAHSATVVIPSGKIDNSCDSFGPLGSGGNTIEWDKANNTIIISGIVKVAGSLDLSSKGSTIYYSGEGTLYVTSDIRVHGSVMPKVMFPTTDAMGCISGRDIFFATGSGESQLKGAGAWYAQRKIQSAKQNQFAGTYVSNYFDMGTNVPNIYQVPALAYNLPPGMPGSQPTVVAQVMSWEHLAQQ